MDCITLAWKSFQKLDYVNIAVSLWVALNQEISGLSNFTLCRKDLHAVKLVYLNGISVNTKVNI
jgi:hypothetical protein